MLTIKQILERLNGLQVTSKDQSIADYILDLASLYLVADTLAQKASIIKIADNYLIALESNFFSKFNNL